MDINKLKEEISDRLLDNADAQDLKTAFIDEMYNRFEYMTDSEIKELHAQECTRVTDTDKLELIEEIADHRAEQADIEELIQVFQEQQIEKLTLLPLKEIKEIYRDTGL